MKEDNTLIIETLGGNSNSFSVLVSRYQSKLLHFLMGVTSCREDAEEILQDTFIRAYNYLYKYDSKWSFSTWLYKIATNVSKDFYRKNKKRIMYKYEYIQQDVEDEILSLESYYEVKECYKNVIELINNLKTDYRIALVLKQIQGFSYADIGKVLGISPQNARVKVFRARQVINDGILKRGVNHEV